VSSVKAAAPGRRQLIGQAGAWRPQATRCRRRRGKHACPTKAVVTKAFADSAGEAKLNHRVTCTFLHDCDLRGPIQ